MSQNDKPERFDSNHKTTLRSIVDNPVTGRLMQCRCDNVSPFLYCKPKISIRAGR